MTVFIKVPWSKPQCYHEGDEHTAQALVPAVGLPTESYYIVCNGKLIQPGDQLLSGATYHVVPRIYGGKGGFGSMLRAIGAQIEKTTNREACRDLSGRRMRDVNNEKQLREWVGKQAEREREKEQRRKERLERRKAMPKHNFDDPQYMEQKALVADNLEDALQQGLQCASTSSATPPCTNSITAEPSTSSDNTQCVASTSSIATAGPSSTCSRKRKSQTVTSSSAKKGCFWMGMEDLEGLDSDSDSDDQEQPGPSGIAAHAMRVDPPENETSDSALSSSPSDLSDKDKSDSGVELESGSLLQRDAPIPVPNSHQQSPPCQASDSDVGEHKMEVEPDSTGEIEEGRVSSKEPEDAISSSEDFHSESTKEATLSHKPGLLAALPPPNMQPSQAEQMEPENFILEDYNCVAKLEALGLDFLKSVLMFRGLKCGGTLQQRAERLFAVKGLAQDQIDRSLLAKPAKGSKK